MVQIFTARPQDERIWNMKEAEFSRQIVKSLKALDIFCYKTSDRFHSGVPDIYVTRGIWIESKVVKVGGQNRAINIRDKMTPIQHSFAQSLSGGGDKFILAVRVEAPKTNHMFLMPYKYLKEMYTVDYLITFPIIGNNKFDLSRYFNPIWLDHVNPEWYWREDEGA